MQTDALDQTIEKFIPIANVSGKKASKSVSQNNITSRLPSVLYLMLHNYMTVMWPMAIVARMLFVRSSACQLWQKKLTLLVILAFVGRSPSRPKLRRKRSGSKPQQNLWRRPRLTLLICLWHHGVENFISKLLLKSTLANNLHCLSSSLSHNLYLSGLSSTRDG